MNEHAGPACALSGLIVGIFAILLHDKNLPPPPPKSPSHDAAIASPAEVKPPRSEPPPPIPPVPRREVVVTPRPAEARPINAIEVGVRAIEVAALGPARPSNPDPPPAPAEPRLPARRPEIPSPRPPFAIVGPGESLADVAARVFGSRDLAEALWKANRDQVERVDSALPRGTLLRAP